MENRVNGQISPENLTRIHSAMNAIRNELPFLLELSPVESKRIVRMEAGRVDFVRKALLLAESNEKIRPQFFEFSEMQNDVNLCLTLDTLIANIEKLGKQLVDTRDQAGHEAYSAALEIYNTAKRGTQKGIPGAQTAYEDLKSMFEGQGKVAKDPAPPKA